jgi:Family of unknown function (DUF6520)
MFYNQILNLMKKIRMMLPMLAFVLAAGAAVAGSFLPVVDANYKVGSNCIDGQTEQSNCQISTNPTFQPCTILVGASHLQAYDDATGCTQTLRQIP